VDIIGPACSVVQEPNLHACTQWQNTITPYELIHSKKPNLTDRPEWGVKVFILKEDHSKLEPKADKGRWVGYSDESKGHRVSWPGKRHITVERNVTLYEMVLITPDDIQTEGEPITQNSQCVTPHNQPPPQPQALMGHIDLLDKFETS
jgi:hypothetical protein